MMKVSPDELNKLLQKKWKIRCDDLEYIEPFWDIIKSDDITGKASHQKKSNRIPAKRSKNEAKSAR